MAKILVVDDQFANRALVVTLILHAGHEPLEAADGAQALALVHAERPDLVISDILMPTMDGYEFVRQLRADTTVANTQVIFYSAHYLEQEAHNLARACGVNEVLLKPCEPQDILDAMDRALKRPIAPALPMETPAEQAFQNSHLRLMTDKLNINMASLEAMNQRLAALTDLNLQLASERDPQILLASVCRGARDLVGAQYAVLCASPRSGTELAVCTSGLDSVLVDALPRPTSSYGLAAQLQAERRSQRINNAQGDPVAAGLPPGYPPVYSAMIVPVTSLSHAYGWICLANKVGDSEFSADDEKILTILGAQVGRIYENGSLYIEIQRHAEQLQIEIGERKRALDELRVSEAGLHRAQLLAKITHVITGKNGVFESWPDSLPQMLDLPPSAMPHSTREWLPLVHPDDQANFRANALEADRKSTRMDFVYRLRRANGTVLYLRQVMEPLLNDGVFIKGQQRWFNTIQDITEQKRAEEELRESDRRFNDMLDKVEMISVMLDREGCITYCNEYLLRLTGWRREEIFGRNWFALFSPPQGMAMKEVFADVLADRPSTWHLDSFIRTRSGEHRLVHWNNTVLRAVCGTVTGVASLGEDITERKEADLKIRRLNRVYAVLSGINTLIVRVQNRDELFRESCHVAVEQGQFKMALIARVERGTMDVIPITMAGAEPAFMQKIADQLSFADNPRTGRTLSATVVREKRAVVSDDIESDPRVLMRDELMERGVASMAALPLLVAGETVGVLVLFADEVGFFDETELKLLTELAGDIGFALDHLAKEERLSYLAYYDDLTGLANRSLFLERVSQHLRPRDGMKPLLGLTLVDISRFRMVNDTLGRPIGDALLKLVAQRLQNNAGEFSVVARVGINSFGIAIYEPRDAGTVAVAVDQVLRACFSAPFQLGGAELRMTAKAGIALYPMDGGDAEGLFRNAEAALNKAKASADSMLFYTSEMNKRVAEALSLEHHLRVALEQEQFVLHYQPKLHLSSGRITGAEALIRWNDPRRGLVLPGQFIALLEETGLIYEVGRWALRQALADNLRWRSAGLPPIRVAVNVSILQLRNRSFITDVREALAGDPRIAAGLELEITESMVMDDVEHSTRSLHAIREMGVTIAIDDFGTGFSSLSYLAKLPVDTLKIDRSFITPMTDGSQGLSLVSTIINLGHSLNLNVIAEGVETKEQSGLLSVLGCDEIQGFLFSKPLPVELFEKIHLRHAPKGG